MSPWVPHNCPEDACKAVQGAAGFRKNFGKLAARPWNMHEPRTTQWWLIPFGDNRESPWPAYRVGKYGFSFSEDRSLIRVGLHVEKGVSTEAAAGLGGKAYVMNDDWTWPKFLADLRSGIAAKFMGDISVPVQVRVSGGPLVPVGGLRPPGDDVVFDWSDERLVLLGKPRKMKSLPPMGGLTTVAELAAALAPFDPGGWTWIDFLIEASFHVGPKQGLDPTDEWTADRLWTGLLAPLARWVR